MAVVIQESIGWVIGTQEIVDCVKNLTLIVELVNIVIE